MRETPELWGGGFEAKANFRPTALLLTYVDDSAILLLAVGDISQDEPVAQSDGCGQSNETTVSTKHDSARGIYEWSFVGQRALRDHRQLRRHSLGAPAKVKTNAMGFGGPVHHMVLTYTGPLARTTKVRGISSMCYP